jgi:CHAT domain-containing protein/Tfp pilus assembly protein PilF
MRYIHAICLLFLFLCCSPMNAAAPRESDSAVKTQSRVPVSVPGHLDNEQLNKLILEGNYAGAREIAERQLADIEAKQGKQANENIGALNNLGWLLQQEGKLGKARQAFSRAVELCSLNNQKDSVLAWSLNNLGLVLYAQGDYSSAQASLEKALSIAETAFGGNSPRTAGIVRSLAGVYDALGDSEKATQSYRKAITIAENQPVPNKLELAQDVFDLAESLANKDQNADAIELFYRALTLRKEILGDDDVAVADCLNNIAMVYANTEKPEEAMPLLDKAKAIYEKAFGMEHLSLVPVLNNIGDVEVLLKQLPVARQNYLRAANIINNYFRQSLPNLSIAEQYAAIEMHSTEQLARILSCTTQETLATDYQSICGWKGTLVDSMAKESLLARKNKGGSPEIVDRLEKLANIRSMLSSWYQQAGTVPLAEWKKRNDILTLQKEEVERSLRSIDSSVQSPVFLLKDFCVHLKDDEAFLDLYRHDDIRSGFDEHAAVSGILTTNKGQGLLVRADDASKIDTLLEEWRQRVISGDDASDSWQKLSQVLKSFLDSVPPSVKKVWVCPDGNLCQIPWQLLERKTSSLTICQIDSPRELLDLKTNAERQISAQRKILVVGGVDFDHGDPGAALSTFSFSKLPGTVTEMHDVAQLAKQEGMSVVELQGAQVTKEQLLKDLQDVNFAHLATHGFFFDEQFMSSVRSKMDHRTRGVVVHKKVEEVVTQPRNPLVESGLALTGANTLTAGNSAVLTAEQFVGSDLHQCELVTLSACDTGRGKEFNGQGVMGLRASIMSAGARNVLMSLWTIPDASTVLLMKLFYSNLWKHKMPPAQALQLAQCALRDQLPDNLKQPIHWAGWVLVGAGWD